jgi:hypothetical protein
VRRLLPEAGIHVAQTPLVFQIKKALEEQGDLGKTTAWKLCAACPGPRSRCHARMLARDFPANRELRRFLTIHAPTAATISPDHNAP